MNYTFATRTKLMEGSPLRENAKKNMEMTDVISFAYGFPPNEAFPLETLARLSHRLYTSTNPELFLQYGATEGHSELRELIKERLAKVTNIPSALEEDLIITSGSSQAIDLTIRILCNEGDVVLCEEQSFSGAINSIKSYGAIPQAIPMNEEKNSMDLGILEETLRKDTEHRIKLIYLIPTFQNPLGSSMPEEARIAIYHLAKKYGVMIYEDDPYGDLLYHGAAIPKIKSFDTEGIVIYGGSFSKILAPSTRLGFVLAEPAITRKMVLAKQVADSHTNFYWQIMLTEFMKNFDFEGHVENLRVQYREKFNLMVSCLEKIDEEKMTFIKPTGGYFICCKMNDDFSEERFYEYLNQHKVAVIPGNIMSVAGEGYQQYFRLNFTKPTLAEIETGIERINQALDYANTKVTV